MKLIGNSVSVPVIDMLIKSIISTGVFDDRKNGVEKKHEDTGNAKMSIPLCGRTAFSQTVSRQ